MAVHSARFPRWLTRTLQENTKYISHHPPAHDGGVGKCTSEVLRNDTSAAILETEHCGLQFNSVEKVARISKKDNNLTHTPHLNSCNNILEHVTHTKEKQLDFPFKCLMSMALGI